MEFYENKDISIICPKCKKFMLKADKRDKRIHKQECKHCRKWIWYIPSDPTYRKIKEVPLRQTSSGKIFY